MNPKFESEAILDAAKVKYLPLDAASIIPEISAALALQGFAFNEELITISEQDSDLEAQIEAKNKEKEESDSIFTIPSIIGRVASHIIFPKFIGVLAFTTKSFIGHALKTLPSLAISSFRAAYTVTTTFVSVVSSACRIALQLATNVILALLKTPAGLALLGLAAVATAGFIVYKKITKGTETPAKVSDENLAKLQPNKKSNTALDFDAAVSSSLSFNDLNLQFKNSKPIEVVTASSKPVEIPKETIVEQQVKAPKEVSRTKQQVAVKKETKQKEQTVKQPAVKVVQQPTVKAAQQPAKQQTFVEKAVQVKNDVVSKTTDFFNAKSEIYETMRKEGWDKMDTTSSRNYSKFGINFSKTRSKEFIRNLTPEKAYEIYKKEYWDAAKVDQVPDILKRVYFNTAVNMGVGTAKKLLKASDATLEGFSTAKWDYYNRLAQKNPGEYAKYLKGWRRRMIREYNESLKMYANYVNANPATVSARNINPVSKDASASGYIKSGKVIYAV